MSDHYDRYNGMDELLGMNLASLGTDLISRRAAIDAIRTVIGDNRSISVCEAVKQLPTIQPEPHWIPVEQELPTEDDDYWATFGAETGWFVDWCSWYHGRWVVWLDDIPNEVSNVVAWCKPMEPYKGVNT